jgi:glyoxylase-like metal-dependent hydrolase (beta-lactamase superfamily II)
MKQPKNENAGVHSVRMLRTAEIDVPSPEVYWMEQFGDWTKLQFQMAVIRAHGKTILVNTGFPEDVTALRKAWADFLGPRADLKRPDEWRTQHLLAGADIDPAKVDYVIVTPIQLYATGCLHLFPNAKFCFSRRGWIEDIIAPTYPHHVPREGCISDEHLRWLLFENNRNLLLIDDTHELLPGLTCRWVGVHHRSSMLVEVQTPRGLVMISDCAFHYANVEENRPLGIAESIIEAHAAYADIRRRADAFVPLYDPLVQERFPGGIIS